MRKGFFELDQFQAILKHLPAEYHSLFEIAFVSKVERRTKAVIPWLFCRPDGVRIYRFYEPWRDACKVAGIQRIPHDFRRTAVCLIQAQTCAKGGQFS